MKRILGVALALALAAGAAAGGRGDGAGSGASGVTTITFWAFPTFTQPAGQAAGTWERQQIAKFEQANPDIRVRLETIDFTSGPDRITSAIEGGTAPDIIFDAPGRIVEWGKNGALVSLDDMFTDSFKRDVGNEALINSCSDGTTYWMYPISTSPFYMGINRELWESVGALRYVNLDGDRSWTTENFIRAMACFKGSGKPGISVYCGGQGGDQGTRALVTNLYGGSVANAEMTRYTFNTPEMIRALRLLKSMYDDGQIDAALGGNGGEDIQRFVQEIFASTICWGSSAAGQQADNIHFTPLSLPFPSDDGVPELEYLVNGFCVFDNNDAARAAAAKKFIQFLCDDPANVVQTNAFPVRQSMGDLYPGNAEMQLLASFTRHYSPYYNTMNGFANMRTEWWNMLQYIFAGTKTVEQAVVDAERAANAGM